MKTLNLMNVKEDDVLNRNEMKTILAGSGGSEVKYKCCYITDLSNCSSCTPAPTKDCEPGFVKVDCALWGW